MISLIIPPKSQISQFSNMLTQEYGTASNIKSRVNRLSVLAAITSTQQRLKLYNRGEHCHPCLTQAALRDCGAHATLHSPILQFLPTASSSTAAPF